MSIRKGDIFLAGVGKDGQDGTNGIDGTNGKDGFSPTVSLTKENNVATISVTDIEGTKSININDNGDILQTQIGSLEALETTDKTSIVNAINEVKASAGGAVQMITTVLYEGGVVSTTNTSSETNSVLSQPISNFDFIYIETHETEAGNNKFQKLFIASEITRLLSSFKTVYLQIGMYETNDLYERALRFYDESNIRAVSRYTGAIVYRIIGINLFK